MYIILLIVGPLHTGGKGGRWWSSCDRCDYQLLSPLRSYLLSDIRLSGKMSECFNHCSTTLYTFFFFLQSSAPICWIQIHDFYWFAAHWKLICLTWVSSGADLGVAEASIPSTFQYMKSGTNRTHQFIKNEYHCNVMNIYLKL